MKANALGSLDEAGLSGVTGCHSVLWGHWVTQDTETLDNKFKANAFFIWQYISVTVYQTPILSTKYSKVNFSDNKHCMLSNFLVKI